MAITSLTETERKYDVDESMQLPPLAELGEVKIEDPVTLRAVYYDTPDGALASRLITLRRRAGGKDEGWHLKTPGINGRTEHQAPLSDELPEEILDLVRAILRGRSVVEVARLTTQRTIATLRGAEGAALVEVADDLVSATDVHTGILRIWREWEAELLEGAPQDVRERAALLDAVESALVGAGATPSSSYSKLARATGRTSLAPAGYTASASSAVSSSESSSASSSDDGELTALDVVLPVIRQLTDAIIATDARVRADETDSVHTMRVTVRRLRSVLAVFRGVLDRTVTDPIRDQLRSLGDVLGTARDAEVRRARGEALLAGKTDGQQNGTGEQAPVFQADGDVQRRLVDDPHGEYRVRLGEVVSYLDSAEYFALLDNLDLLVSRPPVTESSLRPARAVVKEALRRQTRRAHKRLKAVEVTDLDALHAARKASRRVRYVAEALSDGDNAVLGKKTVALAGAAESVQDLLGDHRDAMLFLDRLEETAREATEAGENAAAYGALAAAERSNAQSSIDRLGDARSRLKKTAQR
jgi:CHAD domain-containing protein